MIISIVTARQPQVGRSGLAAGATPAPHPYSEPHVVLMPTSAYCKHDLRHGTASLLKASELATIDCA